MNSEMVKPMPDSAAPPASCSQSGAEQDADELAQHQPGDDAQGDRRGGRGAQRLAGQRDAGVGQGEHRDDDEAGPRLPELLQPLAGRHRPVDREPGGAGELRVG
jgi:hypothetical protein